MFSIFISLGNTQTDFLLPTASEAARNSAKHGVVYSNGTVRLGCMVVVTSKTKKAEKEFKRLRRLDRTRKKNEKYKNL